MVIARLDEETVAGIADAKRSIAAEHSTLLRHARDAQAAAEVCRNTNILIGTHLNGPLISVHHARSRLQSDVCMREASR